MDQLSWEDTYNPPMPRRPEVAKVSVGFTPNGHLAVRVQAVSGVELIPGLQEIFQAAAAAFMREFSRSQTLRAFVKNVGEPGNALEQVGQEIAERDGAPQFGVD